MYKFISLTALSLLSIIACKSSDNKETNTTTNSPANNNNINSLQTQIEKIIAQKNATVGVSIIGNNAKDIISINADQHFPMQSVFKFHIALAVLAEVDKGKFSLDQNIKVSKDQLFPAPSWSPLRDENPDGGNFTIRKLIQYAVSLSDNSACDILISLLGTPKTIETYIKSVGINDIQIIHNEQVMQAAWDNMFENWTSPKAASQTLQLFYENKNNLLSKASHEFFWQTNKETSTGPNRLKGQLPEGTVVAHKTGTSGTHEETGISGAINDIGIVFLPNNQYFIISVFVTNSKENAETNDKIIADIAKAAYDFYTSHQ